MSLKVDDLVDWLELAALFDEFHVARVDALIGSLLEQEETPEDDIGERDKKREQLVEELENEVEKRRQALGPTYPFQLSDAGDELIANGEWRDTQFAFYLICLVAAHVTGSEILLAPPAGQMLTTLRNQVFQIIATLGLAGLTRGPAFSVGWPRQQGETIIALLTRAAAAGGGFTVRNPPGQYTPPQEKDGGVDVIAWTPGGRPPPTAFFFGQTASGKNWTDKPVADHARTFERAYMQDLMTGNLSHVTVIPYRVLDERDWNHLHQFHRAILDRLRLPLCAWEGLQLGLNGVAIDGADRVDELRNWLGDFYDYAKAA
ncbi:hypothetical protein ACETKC_00255 [Brevundimonas intermedia]|uniref:hypothetical protein n=1 Tax=Brevundimonas intermedia TaxID=74315 RepID=UPI0022F27850|nr:hypothetical protein [Brevundimonas intermedia]